MPRTPRRRVSATTAEATASPGSEPTRRLRENLPRPTAAPPSGPSSRGPVQPARRRSPFGFFSRLTPRFAGDIFAELRKVTWPSFSETRYLTFVVAVVAVLVGTFLGLLDLGFGWVVEQLFF